MIFVVYILVYIPTEDAWEQETIMIEQVHILRFLS